MAIEDVENTAAETDDLEPSAESTDSPAPGEIEPAQGQEATNDSQLPAEQQAPKMGKKERREAWKRQHDLAEQYRRENHELRREIESLTRASAATNKSVNDLIEHHRSTLPQPKSPHDIKTEALLKEFDSVVARINEPGMYQRFRALQQEIADARAEAAVSRARSEWQKELDVRDQRLTSSFPKPQTPAEQKFFAEYPFAAEPKWKDHIRLAVQEISATQNRDLSNPAVLEATVREAAAFVANTWKIPLPNRQRPGRPEEFASLGGRQHPSGESGMDSDNLSRADILAATRYLPGYEGLTPEQQIAKWMKTTKSFNGLRSGY